MIARTLLGPYAPSWEREGRDWPHREASRFVRAGGIRWHVQVLGREGPPALLLHGLGGASHSFRDLAPILATKFRVIVPDLPGHGFTELPTPERLGLVPISRAIVALLAELGSAPRVAVGHSAGAAIALRACLDGVFSPDLVVGINAALYPPKGFAGLLFAPTARLMSSRRGGFGPQLMAFIARDPRSVKKTIEGTGSRLDPRGIELYHRLARRPRHVAGTVGVMAEWDLNPLVRDLPRFSGRLTLIVGDKDRAIAPRDAERVATSVRGVEVVRMRGLGHLSHEERPRETAAHVFDAAARAGILSRG